MSIIKKQNKLLLISLEDSNPKKLRVVKELLETLQTGEQDGDYRAFIASTIGTITEMLEGGLQ